MTSSLVDLIVELRHAADALADPAAGGPNVADGLAVVRTLVAQKAVPLGTAPNLTLQSPSDGVPLPSADIGSRPGAQADAGLVAVSPPLAQPGPPGPPGPAGPPGARGPTGPGIDPARFQQLEQAVLFLQDLALTQSIGALYGS